MFILSCHKNDTNPDNSKILALGHGGMGSGNMYPMNSYESVLKCLNLGMDGAEIDVQMTKDSVLIAFHDRDLSETTTLKGLVYDLTWEEVRKAHYLAAPYLNYNIVSIEEILEHIPNSSHYIFTFDCKLYTNDQDKQYYKRTFINAIIRLLNKYHITENIFIESQDEAFLKELKAINPDLKLFIYPDSFRMGLEIALTLNLYGITISTEKISKEEIEEAQKQNLFVAIWGVRSEKANKEAVGKKPDAIQTDHIKSLLKLLK